MKIKLRSYNRVSLDSAVKAIANAVSSTGSRLRGPIRLPRSLKKFTVNKSPHVHGSSKEQFGIFSYKVLFILENVKSRTVESLRSVKLEDGVDAEIKFENE